MQAEEEKYGDEVLDEVLHDEKLSILHSYIDQLKPREKRILQLRNDGATLNEVSKIYDVCRERIRQIEMRAIRKIMMFHSATEFKSVPSQIQPHTGNCVVQCHCHCNTLRYPVNYRHIHHNL